MMRKLAVLVLMTGVAAQCAWAKSPAHFNLSLVPTVETSSAADIEGLDLGILASTKDTVEGAQTGFVYAQTRTKSVGLQLALITKSRQMYGLQYGAVNVSGKVIGEMGGFVNVSDEIWGVSSGLVNVSKNVKGVMSGFVNVSDEISGLQFGLVNYTRDMEGIQIGLINIISRSSLPAMIIVNGRFK